MKKTSTKWIAKPELEFLTYPKKQSCHVCGKESNMTACMEIGRGRNAGLVRDLKLCIHCGSKLMAPWVSIESSKWRDNFEEVEV